MNRQGMIAIPALHDAASDRPVPFTPVCSHTAIPVCLNPAFASYLPVTLAALQPVLSQLAACPGRLPDQPGGRGLSPGSRQRGCYRPGWAAAHRPATGLPAAAARPARRTPADRAGVGQPAADQRRARHRGQRDRRRSRGISGPAGGHRRSPAGSPRRPAGPGPGACAGPGRYARAALRAAARSAARADVRAAARVAGCCRRPAVRRAARRRPARLAGAASGRAAGRPADPGPAAMTTGRVRAGRRPAPG